MKKETFTEKLIKRTYGISDPLDEYKRREADRIGNKIFVILFYLMTLGNLIPFVLAYKYPQIVAIGYPLVVFGISMISALYVVSQTRKTGITAIDLDMLSQKESKQLHLPGLKAGLFFGIAIFFIMPLIDTLTSENPNFISSLLNSKHILKTILGAFFFGLIIQIIISRRIEKAKKEQEDD